jgi:membrane dipeptidase
MLIFDAHLDLAMNALEWNRDLTQPIQHIRERETTLTDRPDRGRGTVCLPEMRRGNVALCVATQIARFVKPGNSRSGWHSPAQAWAQTQGQLAWYRAMEELGEMVQITDQAGLRRHLELWQDQLVPHAQPDPVLRSESGQKKRDSRPVGYILSLEGADSIMTMRHLERAYDQGLRAVGPAHYGPGTYAQGTDATGGLGARGRELLTEMGRLGIILDVAHLCDESFWEAVDHFPGPLWASHANCRALVPHHRQLTDDQIKCLVQRGGIVGSAMDAWMLIPNWERGVTTPQTAGLKLDDFVNHIDHVCQIAGNARHAGIGSDLDGAFGREQSPADLETIADLQRLPDLFRARGYAADDIQLLMGGNFIRFLEQAWG